jgi:hypothetical protein
MHDRTPLGEELLAIGKRGCVSAPRTSRSHWRDVLGALMQPRSPE